MALMEHSAHCCNRLGKLAESQHTSYMSQPQTERGGGAESERARLVEKERKGVRESGLVENKEKPLELLAGNYLALLTIKASQHLCPYHDPGLTHIQVGRCTTNAWEFKFII